MPEGTEHHLEQAEHAQHAFHDPFNRRVALSMALIAAALAAVSMLGHKAHNATLLYQTQASDQWTYYQTKKQRGYAKEDFAELARYGAFLANKGKPGTVGDRDENGGSSDSKVPGQGSKGAKAEAKKKIKVPSDAAKLPAYWKEIGALYREEADGIQEKARELEEESHHAHAKAERLDMGHLGLEIALVLCSIALLARQKSLWFTGMGVALLGACASFSAYLIGH